MRAVLVVAVVLLGLDLLWLGVVAQGFYRDALGDLLRPKAFWPAALGFYLMYVAAIVVHAVRPAADVKDAAQRGAAMGLLAYATFELTAWALLTGWPARLVPVDILWGVVLTAAAAAAGRRFA